MREKLQYRIIIPTSFTINPLLLLDTPTRHLLIASSLATGVEHQLIVNSTQPFAPFSTTFNYSSLSFDLSIYIYNYYLYVTIEKELHIIEQS